MNTITKTANNGTSAYAQAESLLPSQLGGTSDWRQEIMLDALRCRARDGSPEYAILHALQRRLPTYATRVFYENTIHTEEALRQILPDLTACLSSSLCGNNDEDSPITPVFGWWRGTWPGDGQTYEIALSPNHYTQGEWIVAGPTVEGTTALSQAIIDFATRDAVRFQVFSNGCWEDAPEVAEEVTRTSWDDIVLAPAQIADIRAAVENFFESESIFRRMNFAWRRGILLVGPPGTGKTMVCRAAASSRRDVAFLYVRDLRDGRGNRDMLATIFSRARRLAPCILAIEDLEGLIDGENRTMFLNELDGFKRNDGLLIIASSNHPEKIDEALLKRPSRFDRVYHVGLPAQSERETYARLLLGRAVPADTPVDTASIEGLAQRIGAATGGFTPALIKEAIMSTLLEQAQAGIVAWKPEEIEMVVLRQIDYLRDYLKKANNPLRLAESIGEQGEIGFRSR